MVESGSYGGYNLVPQDVTDAIRRQNIEAAPGKTGISSDKLPQQLQYVLQYTGKFSTPEEYGEIVLKALPDGSLLRLRDVVPSSLIQKTITWCP